ncbi:Pentatricopeptide repeat-containing protein [Acorus gramineus]|uniref:Pentatricopeptide repeat-containing protein n=1 Tax=Acorus gramineus TaxID=55184 RepID=A0AAV9AL91_ACOGR|nr:Pentatricopeptide repeat-containing protein [Acorus gramineus]
MEAIEELERSSSAPSEVLCEGRLSAREIQLVLVHLSGEGRDSWCALEVFEWLRREDRVDGETMELMASIACRWIGRVMAEEGHDVEEVVVLVKEMECAGLEPPGFDLVEKAISMYWEGGRREEAVRFVEGVMRRRRGGGGVGGGGGVEGGKGGPIGYLAWKMMLEGDYNGAVKLVIKLKDLGFEPEVYAYLIALTALVKELGEFSKALRKLKGMTKDGLVAELDEHNQDLIERYQSDILNDGLRLSTWAIKHGNSSISGLVHERLLTMYACANRGIEAENQLWQMKLSGRQPNRELYDIVLAICASQKEIGSIKRLLAGMEATSAEGRRKTFSWLLRGYIKGGYFLDASETLIKMLDMGLLPEYLDRAAVLQGLRKNIIESGDIEPYLNLCKRLCDMDLIGPCIVYLYFNAYKLWIMKMV